MVHTLDCFWLLSPLSTSHSYDDICMQFLLQNFLLNPLHYLYLWTFLLISLIILLPLFVSIGRKHFFFYYQNKAVHKSFFPLHMILYVSFLLHHDFKNMIFRFLFIFLKGRIYELYSEKVLWIIILLFSAMQTHIRGNSKLTAIVSYNGKLKAPN